eukprot:4157549-Prymnesium_polylepis.3
MHLPSCVVNAPRSPARAYYSSHCTACVRCPANDTAITIKTHGASSFSQHHHAARSRTHAFAEPHE